MQLSCEDMNVARLLIDASRHLGTTLVSCFITHAVVGVFLNLIDGDTQHGVGLPITEPAFEVRASLLRSVIIIPPDMHGMEASL